LNAHTTYDDMYCNKSTIDCGTYIPTRGDKCLRIDYVFCTDSVSFVPLSARVADELSVRASDKRDHRPLACAVVFSCSDEQIQVRRRVVDYDIKSFKDPHKANAFVNLITDPCNAIDVSVDNSSHCFLSDSLVHDALVTCFPMPDIQVKCDFLTKTPPASFHITSRVSNLCLRVCVGLIVMRCMFVLDVGPNGAIEAADGVWFGDLACSRI